MKKVFQSGPNALINALGPITPTAYKVKGFDQTATAGSNSIPISLPATAKTLIGFGYVAGFAPDGVTSLTINNDTKIDNVRSELFEIGFATGGVGQLSQYWPIVMPLGPTNTYNLNFQEATGGNEVAVFFVYSEIPMQNLF